MIHTSAVQNSSSNRRNKFIAYLLVATALVSATKDISSLQNLTSRIHAGLTSVYSGNLTAARSCSTVHKQETAGQGKGSGRGVQPSRSPSLVLPPEPP